MVLLAKVINLFVRRSVVRWDLGGTISSGYLAHCPSLFFTSICVVFWGSYICAISEPCDTRFPSQIVYYKHRILSVFSEVLVSFTATLIPGADCALLLHQLVVGPVIYIKVPKCTHRITDITLNASQTVYADVFQLGFEPASLVQRGRYIFVSKGVVTFLSTKVVSRGH